MKNSKYDISIYYIFFNKYNSIISSKKTLHDFLFNNKY